MGYMYFPATTWEPLKLSSPLQSHGILLKPPEIPLDIMKPSWNVFTQRFYVYVKSMLKFKITIKKFIWSNLNTYWDPMNRQKLLKSILNPTENLKALLRPFDALWNAPEAPWDPLYRPWNSLKRPWIFQKLHKPSLNVPGTPKNGPKISQKSFVSTWSSSKRFPNPP